MLLMVKVVGQGHVIVTFQKFFCREANPKDTKFTSWSILEDGLNFADMQRECHEICNPNFFAKVPHYKFTEISIIQKSLV